MKLFIIQDDTDTHWVIAQTPEAAIAEVLKMYEIQSLDQFLLDISPNTLSIAVERDETRITKQVGNIGVRKTAAEWCLEVYGMLMTTWRAPK